MAADASGEEGGVAGGAGESSRVRGVVVKVEETDEGMAAPNPAVKIEHASGMDGGVASGDGI